MIRNKTMYPEGKKQIRDNIVEWVDQPMSLKLQKYSLGELRATVLILQIFAKPEMQL